jgi:zinc transporter ZupT
MRKVPIVILVAFSYAVPAAAQTTAPSNDSHRFLEVIIGAAALAVGATVAATSSQTTTNTSAVGTSETSSHSTSQLATGLVIAGAGGFILWDGLREHDKTRPSTAVGVAAGQHSGGLFIRRKW